MSEQDERRHKRVRGRLEAYLIVDGGPWRCWIRDISIGGAGLEPAIPAALGKYVALSSPHFQFSTTLAARVINVANKRTCLSFELDAATREKLLGFLATAEP